MPWCNSRDCALGMRQCSKAVIPVLATFLIQMTFIIFYNAFWCSRFSTVVDFVGRLDFSISNARVPQMESLQGRELHVKLTELKWLKQC